jgi:hypothetical protein
MSLDNSVNKITFKKTAAEVSVVPEIRLRYKEIGIITTAESTTASIDLQVIPDLNLIGLVSLINIT